MAKNKNMKVELETDLLVFAIQEKLFKVKKVKLTKKGQKLLKDFLDDLDKDEGLLKQLMKKHSTEEKNEG